jgi:hypothetical protein
MREIFAAPAHVRLWHHPEIPDGADYFRLLMCCGHRATAPLTDRCQFGMFGPGWQGQNAIRSTWTV